MKMNKTGVISIKELEESQKKFYLCKFKNFGDDPRSMSLNDKKSQYLRFQKILKLFKYEKTSDFSIHEVGCGLAHFKEFLDSLGYSCIYSGSDIIPEFIELCKKKYPQCYLSVQNIADDYDQIDDAIKGNDYYCLSGTFNPKEDNTVHEWELFIFKSIKNMFKLAKNGIGFNFLTSYSEFYDNKLYYADPKEIMDWCVKNLSRFISIEHDIPLYEFFVYVYKEDYIKEKFQDYGKYF